MRTRVGHATVPNWVPFRVPGSPRGPFCGFGSPLGLLFCLKVKATFGNLWQLVEQRGERAKGANEAINQDVLVGNPD